MSVQDKGTCVSILDKEYRISCPEGQQNSLNEAAEYLDKQMRQIRRNGRVIGAERIAVMAALNIAHELLTLKSKPQEPVENFSNRVKLMQSKIDDAIIKTQKPETPNEDFEEKLELSQQTIMPFAEEHSNEAARDSEVAYDEV